MTKKVITHEMYVGARLARRAPTYISFTYLRYEAYENICKFQPFVDKLH